MNTTFLMSSHVLSVLSVTVVFTVLLLLTIAWIYNHRSFYRQWILMRRRSAHTYESFACFFSGQGVPEPLLQETYRLLAGKITSFSSFPVHPLDSLQHVYGVDCYRDGTLADFMNAIQISCQMNFCKPVPAFLPCNTVADLVYVLAARGHSVYALMEHESSTGQVIHSMRDK
jgi:hypothetical protein